MNATADTYLRCTRCGREGTTSFARSLEDGWPRCCGLTMRLERTDADIAEALRGRPIPPELRKAVRRP